MFDLNLSAQLLPEDAPDEDALSVAQISALPEAPHPNSYCLVSFRVSRLLLVSVSFTDGAVAVRTFDVRADAALARSLSRLGEGREEGDHR